MSYIKHKIPVRLTREKLMLASLLYVGENGICTNELAGRLLEPNPAGISRGYLGRGTRIRKWKIERNKETQDRPGGLKVNTNQPKFISEFTFTQIKGRTKSSIAN